MMLTLKYSEINSAIVMISLLQLLTGSQRGSYLPPSSLTITNAVDMKHRTKMHACMECLYFDHFWTKGQFRLRKVQFRKLISSKSVQSDTFQRLILQGQFRLMEIRIGF